MGSRFLMNLDEVGSDSEQGGEDREQETKCACQEEVCQHGWTLDAGLQEGACGSRSRVLSPSRRAPHSTSRRRSSILSEAFVQSFRCMDAAKRQLQVWGILRLSSAGASTESRAATDEGQLTEYPIPLYTFQKISRSISRMVYVSSCRIVK